MPFSIPTIPAISIPGVPTIPAPTLPTLLPSGGVVLPIPDTGNFIVVTGTSEIMKAGKRYLANNAALVSLTLPETAELGQTIDVYGVGAGGWEIVQLAGQQIHDGSSASTLGEMGGMASVSRYDSTKLVCVVANTTWAVCGGGGSPGLS